MRAAAIFGLGTSPSRLKPFQSGSPTHWIEGLPASSSDADAIVIFGGDGTIHRHLGALVRLGLPVLVVPAGSGNDFARALNLRSLTDSLHAWRNFEAGKLEPRVIDLGVIAPADASSRQHYFCTVAACGLDSAVAKLACRMPRWLRSRGGYALGLAPAMAKFSAFPLRITSQQGATHRSTESPTTLAAFANTPFYGDGMRIAPTADLGDGLLDVCVIREINRLKLLTLFPTVYFGRHLNMREVEYSKLESARLQTTSTQDIYADGEYVCTTPVEIRAARSALRVIRPSGNRST
jgi:diacylglycerol kinase (ATP)